MKIFVGNLPYSTSTDDLVKLFSKFGEVKSAYVSTDPPAGPTTATGVNIDAQTSVAREDRVITTLDSLFQLAARPAPESLKDWEERVGGWCSEYQASSAAVQIVEINLGQSVYLFDLMAERVVLSYGISVHEERRRDTARMRGYPNVHSGVKHVLGDRAFLADRGHFLGHASGGTLDINLFPQRRELNRGWSSEGKRFRQMERYAAAHPGLFFYHRPMYDDDTWIPDRLEYGLLVDDVRWWLEQFHNK